MPDLRRFDPVDDSDTMFKGISIPQGWDIPENVWVVVQRVDRIQEAAIALYERAPALLQSASDYVKLVNRRDDFLFSRDEMPEESDPSFRRASTINDVLSLSLKPNVIINWNAQYFAARHRLEATTAALAFLVTDASFLQNAQLWCPPGSLNRIDLEEWYEAKVQSLLLESPKWTNFTFTFRDILLQVVVRRRGTRISADVLVNADLTRKHGINVRRQLIYQPGIHPVDIPDCGLAWVSDKLLEQIEKQAQRAGPLL